MPQATFTWTAELLAPWSKLNLQTHAHPCGTSFSRTPSSWLWIPVWGREAYNLGCWTEGAGDF